MEIMKVKKILFIILLITPFIFVKAQSKESANLNLSGNIFLDSKLAVNYYDSLNTAPAIPNYNKRSQYLAGLMSLVLPGAGEAYSENYLKAAIFLTIEAAAITTALIYNHKGDFQTSFFQQFANQHWSVVKYAQWTLNNLKIINPDATDAEIAQYKAGGAKPVLTGPENSPTGVNWRNLNDMESSLGTSGYSHQLPGFGEQQYYELIGKYPQYSHGWNDSNAGDTDYHILSYNFNWYSHQRGLANEYYKTGSFGVGLLYVNHILSALDAIWSMDKYNGTLAMNVRLNSEYMTDHIELIPTFNLSFNF
ncbi:MAG: hypothetical protein P4L45_13890 [Ignavibacteriaceae bacterium]|nr:hypothetical protein [Ignavibacteriaceae bacterium]